MKIGVFGLGYVGAVSAACFANDGHDIVGVDTNEEKVALLRQGYSPIIEPGLPELLREAVQRQRLFVSNEAASIVDCDLFLVCVGTPSQDDGSLDLRQVRRVALDIGHVLAEMSRYHVVVIRSTILPGSMESQIIPILEKTSGKRAGVDFGVVYNPEFLREGSAIQDFYHPPKIVIGELDARSGEPVSRLYQRLAAPLVRTDIRSAEMIKYANNAFHALKVTFANEIGVLCKQLDIDSHQLMSIFCLDTTLNISPAYLKPGAPFGGSCLPKDLRALTHYARAHGEETPLLDAILTSNEVHMQRCLKLVLDTGSKRIAVLGLSFKNETDDLRESHQVSLVKSLLDHDCTVQIYEPNLSLERLIGSNKAQIEQEIPGLAALLKGSVAEAIEGMGVIVIGYRHEEFLPVLSMISEQQEIVDLGRLTDAHSLDDRYHGICW